MQVILSDLVLFFQNSITAGKLGKYWPIKKWQILLVGQSIPGLKLSWHHSLILGYISTNLIKADLIRKKSVKDRSWGVIRNKQIPHFGYWSAVHLNMTGPLLYETWDINSQKHVKRTNEPDILLFPMEGQVMCNKVDCSWEW